MHIDNFYSLLINFLEKEIVSNNKITKNIYKYNKIFTILRKIKIFYF